MPFASWTTKAKTQTHTHNTQFLFLHNWLIPCDLVKSSAATINKSEKPQNDVSVITICVASQTVPSKEGHKETKILLFHCSFAHFIYPHLSVTSDINLPWQYFYSEM